MTRTDRRRSNPHCVNCRLSGTTLSALVAALLTLQGCRNEDTGPAASTPEAPPEIQASDETANSTPDVAVMAVIEGFQQNHPEALWQFLPSRYQSDINTLVREFATEMDDEVWQKATDTLQMAVTLLKTKKDIVLQTPDLATQFPGTRVDTDALAERWDSVVGALEILLNSSLGNLRKLQAFDGQQFLETSGRELLTQLLTDEDRKRFADVSVRVLSMEGDRADVELTDLLGKTTRRTFVRVDGKWIPETLAMSWAPGVQRVRQSLSALPAAVADSKPAILARLDQIQTGLQQAQQADDQQQLIQALLPVTQAFLGGQMADEESTLGLGLPADQIVTVRILKSVDDRQRDQINTRLMALVDSSAEARAGIELLDDEVVFTVGPVKDIQAFAEKLEFLTVLSLDAKERSISAEPAP